MEIRQLSYFLGIVEHKNLSKAAQALHIAQPALSLQLKKLEEEVGVVLIDRSTRYFQMTEAGILFATRARQIIELTEKASQEVREMADSGMGTIRIGTIGSEMEVMLPEIMAKFRRVYPKATFRCLEGSTSEVMNHLEIGLIDIGIVRSPIDVTFFNAKALKPSPMVAARKEKSFDAKELTWSDLKNEDLIVHNRFHESIVRSCRLAGFIPNIIASVEDTRSLMLMTATGMGTAIVQEDWLKIAPTPLTSCPIDCEALITQTVIVWQKDKYMSKVAHHFIEFMQKQLSAY